MLIFYFSFSFLIISANGGGLKFEDEFIGRCMTIIGSASQKLHMVHCYFKLLLQNFFEHPSDAF